MENQACVAKSIRLHMLKLFHRCIWALNCYALNSWNRCVYTEQSEMLQLLCSGYTPYQACLIVLSSLCVFITHPKLGENGSFKWIQLRCSLVLEWIIKWGFGLFNWQMSEALWLSLCYNIHYRFFSCILLPLSPPSIPLVPLCDGVLSVLILLHQGQQDRWIRLGDWGSKPL